MRSRKPWVAFLFSLLCAGLGQLYNGNFRLALAVLAAGVAFTTVATVYLFDSFPKLMLALGFGLVFNLVVAVQAWREARRLGVVALRPYQRWWIYAGFVIVLYGLPDGYGFFMPSRILSFQIPSESMVPTLLIGDRLVADGWSYWGKDPQRGDVVVFDYPKDPSTKYVKRMVGLPGDVVETRAGELYLNGQKVPLAPSAEPLVADSGWERRTGFVEDLEGRQHPIYRSQPAMNENFGPVTVPADKFFVMGDNRDRSSDSRVWGFVPRELLLGRMLYIYFSWDAENGRVRGERIGREIH